MPTMNSNDERIAREVLQAVAQITFLMRDHRNYRKTVFSKGDSYRC